VRKLSFNLIKQYCRIQYPVIEHISFIVLVVALASLIILGATGSLVVNGEKYRAKLKGKSEVPKVDTAAKGSVTFKSKKESFTWKMNVTGVSNLTGAQLYLGNKSIKGDVIVDLMKIGNQTQSPAGFLMNGLITPADLQGPLQGSTLDVLKSNMNNSQTYVNILTKAHPGGEIRGPVKIVLPKNQTTNMINTTINTTANVTQVQK
jgi:hypothetical protein